MPVRININQAAFGKLPKCDAAQEDNKYGKNRQSSPVSLRKVQVTDAFWKHEMELVRREVIPYQWEALNDRIPEADPSFCMRNFKIAGK